MQPCNVGQVHACEFIPSKEHLPHEHWQEEARR
jgi:hypothetical protein